MRYFLPLLFFVLILTFGLFSIISCDDDDDDEDTDDEPKTDDDDTTTDDDDDSSSDGICLNDVVIDPLPNPGMIPTSNCASCHNDTDAQKAHGGDYDGGAPDTCMTATCHGCP